MNDDELDELKAAMRAAMPAPDVARKAANLALARKNFERLQESVDVMRPTPDCPQAGLARRTRMILDRMTTRTALTTMVLTSATVTIGAVTLLPMGDALDPRQIFGGDTYVAPELLPDELSEADAIQDVSPLLASPDLSDGLTGIMVADLGPFAGSTGSEMIGQRNIEKVLLPQERWARKFAGADEGRIKLVAEHPVSTFSIDVDTASYSVVRAHLLDGHLPPPKAVRTEEMINYFHYAHPAPTGDTPFQPTVSVIPSPWNADTKLVHIAIRGALPKVEDHPPLNLVFLIDTSGSMDQTDKLPLLKQSLHQLLPHLRPEDEVAIVSYADSAGLVLDPTNARKLDVIRTALGQLNAGGSTAGQAGLQLAYATAQGMTEEGEVTRVILATDGDFNVGLSGPEELEDFIERQARDGAYLSVLGFGRDHLNDVTMQALAQHGNGMAAHIDTLGEAQKVLVDQLSGMVFPIADDVKIQVEFNPAQIAEYRLIGYETRALRREDFRNDSVDAGEIGAGHSVTAIYEITPVNSPARLTERLRYMTDVITSSSKELGFLRLRYKVPGTATSRLIEQPITADLAPSPEAGFAAAIAGFGQLLRGSDYLGDWSWDDAIALANTNRSNDPYGYRAEAVRLMRLAQTLDKRR